MTHITVEGTPYVLPALDTFDLDEAMVLYDYAEMTFDQVWELEGLHPGVIGALLHVAIQRSDRALRTEEVREMVGRVNMMEVMVELSQGCGGDARPYAGRSAASRKRLEDKQRRVQRYSSGTDGSDASEHSPEKSNPVSTGLPTSETVCNLRPDDVGSLTPDQLMDAYDHQNARG